MMDWIPTEQTPSAPGLYWTVRIVRDAPDKRGVRVVHYWDEGRRKWDGEKWDRNGFTHYYGERVVNARGAW